VRDEKIGQSKNQDIFFNSGSQHEIFPAIGSTFPTRSLVVKTMEQNTYYVRVGIGRHYILRGQGILYMP
jgi:hypothetical protein